VAAHVCAGPAPAAASRLTPALDDSDGDRGREPDRGPFAGRFLASVTVATLVLDSEGSSDDLTGMAAAVAGGMSNASHRSLAGEWHGVPDDVLAPVLIEFFRS